MLAGMDTYFKAFDTYVLEKAVGESISETLQIFDHSDECPIFPQYTRFAFTERVAAASQRHPLAGGFLNDLKSTPAPDQL